MTLAGEGGSASPIRAERGGFPVSRGGPFYGGLVRSTSHREPGRTAEGQA